MNFQRDGRRGPLLRLDQLEPAEKELVQQDLRARRLDDVQPDERRMARVQAEVLAEWGVMCPHPSSSLDQIGKLDVLGLKAGKPVRSPVCSCDACGAAVFPLQWRVELEQILARG